MSYIIKKLIKSCESYYIEEEIMLNNNLIYGVNGTAVIDNSIIIYTDK